MEEFLKLVDPDRHIIRTTLVVEKKILIRQNKKCDLQKLKCKGCTAFYGVESKGQLMKCDSILIPIEIFPYLLYLRVGLYLFLIAG